MFGSELTIPSLVMRLFAGLIIVTVHGLAIAAAAVLLGDKGPRYDGRLTALPTAHVDMLGLGAIMLSGFGWGRPVAIEAEKLRPGRWGLVVAALVGSLALLLLGYLLPFLAIPLLSVLPLTPGLTMAAFVRVGARLCVWIGLFSLLPIPPLAGAHFLTALGVTVPRRAGLWLGWTLAAASVFGLTRMLLLPAYNVVAPLVLGADIVH